MEQEHDWDHCCGYYREIEDLEENLRHSSHDNPFNRRTDCREVLAKGLSTDPIAPDVTVSAF